MMFIFHLQILTMQMFLYKEVGACPVCADSVKDMNQKNTPQKYRRHGLELPKLRKHIILTRQEHFDWRGLRTDAITTDAQVNTGQIVEDFVMI